MPKKGKELKIISQNEKTKNFKLDEAVLASVLLRDDVKDKPVCVVAVAGAFRKGKSFLLNYFLRYCASQSKENWMGSPSDPLEGFSWVKSSQRETTGILIWSEPFIVKLRSGEEVAILLMDTQGTFDTKSSSKDSTVVFALTLLVSSVVVYNLMGYIQEDDLMNLDAFIQYGLLARGGGDAATAFQKILFLVRDWIHPDESAYGAHGGQQFLDDILEVKKYQDQAHQDLRRNLRKCFSDISCYLMPRPGDVAVTNKYFNGRHSELDGDFVEHLKKLVQLLLAPQNIEKRTLAGQTIKAEDLFKNFKIFADAFNSKDLPDPVHVANSMAKARCAVVAKKAKELYDNGMKKFVEKDSLLGEEDLKALHSSSYQRALNYYRSRSCGITERISSSYEQQLIEGIAKERCAVAVKKAKKLYVNGMKHYIDEDNVLSEEDLEALHSSLHHGALTLYRSYGINERISSIYERQLIQELTSLQKKFVEKNTRNAEIKKAKAERDESVRSKQFYKRVAFVAGGVAAAVGCAGAVVAAPAIAAVAGVEVEALPVAAAAAVEGAIILKSIAFRSF